MKVRCIELPDGYTSRYSRMTVGKVYNVLEIRGSCYIVKDDTGEDAQIYRGRFEPVEDAEEK